MTDSERKAKEVRQFADLEILTYLTTCCEDKSYENKLDIIVDALTTLGADTEKRVAGECVEIAGTFLTWMPPYDGKANTWTDIAIHIRSRYELEAK